MQSELSNQSTTGVGNAAHATRMSSYTGHSSRKCFRSSTCALQPVLARTAWRIARVASSPEHRRHRRAPLGTFGRRLRPCSTSKWAQPMRSCARTRSTPKGKHNLVYSGALPLEKSFLHYIATTYWHDYMLRKTPGNIPHSTLPHT